MCCSSGMRDIESRLKAHLLRGQQYQNQQQFQSAAWEYQIAQQLSPQAFAPWWHLGQLFQCQGCYQEAHQYYDKALPLASDPLLVYEALATVCQLQGEPDQAQDYWEQILRVAPHHSRAKLNLALLLPVIYPSEGRLLQWREGLAEKVALLGQQNLNSDILAAGMLHFWLSYQGQSDRAVLAKLAQIYRQACPELTYTAPHCNPPSRHPGRVRIGFASAHWYQHTISRLFGGLMMQLSPQHFEVWGLALSPYTDTVTAHLAQNCEHWANLPPHLSTAQQQIAALQLDVLFYPDIGMEPLSYFLAFSRLAPIQIATWGHPQTTGIDTLDYFLSSEALESAATSENYTEQILLMKQMLPYYPRPPELPSRKQRGDFGLPSQGHLYLCPQSLFKIHPRFDTWVAAIMQQDPQGFLVLIRGQPEWTRTLHQRLIQCIPTEKILWLPRLTADDFRQVAALAEVVLDPPFLSGGHSSYEILASGTPIVTWPSPWLKGRLTAALYQQMGLSDCIASHEADYISLALRLAGDRVYRTAVSHQIQSHFPRIYACQSAVDEFSEQIMALFDFRQE